MKARRGLEAKEQVTIRQETESNREIEWVDAYTCTWYPNMTHARTHDEGRTREQGDCSIATYVQYSDVVDVRSPSSFYVLVVTGARAILAEHCFYTIRIEVQ